MKQTVDAIITLPVKAIFKAVYFYFMFHKRKIVDSMDDYLDFFEITRLVCCVIVA